MQTFGIRLALSIIILPSLVIAQPVRSRIWLEQGQVIPITMNLKTVITQEAMNQAIDIEVEGTAIHQYTVTNISSDGYTLHHQVNQLSFNYSGMGQKKSFNSKNEADLNGEFGPAFKDLLKKTYDMVIDTTGKVVSVRADSVESIKMDDRLSMIATMLRGLVEIVQPPSRDEPEYFKILPETPSDTGKNWTEIIENTSGKSSTDYTLASITDSTVLVTFLGQSSTVIKSTFMGNETTTSMNHKSKGNIVIDKKTGLVRVKSNFIESNGSTEAMGGKVPVISRTSIIIKPLPNPLPRRGGLSPTPLPRRGACRSLSLSRQRIPPFLGKGGLGGKALLVS